MRGCRFAKLWPASNANRFQRAGLSATQFMTLNVVTKDGMTLSELARKLNLSAATLNETVNSLEERALVSRKQDPSDARKVIIRATERGEDMQNSASEEFHASMSALLARMSKTRGRSKGVSIIPISMADDG
jgi:DNA-binding MarR family transcriptional regulator